MLKRKFGTDESENKQKAREESKMSKCMYECFEGYSESTKWTRHTEFMRQTRKAHIMSHRNQNCREHFEDLNVEGRTTLTRILRKQNVIV